MTIHNIRDHAYHFEHALQQSDYKTPPITIQTTGNFTWLVFIHAKWVPFANPNQHKLEQTLGLGGTFVDIQDDLFPGVKRVRVFPKANYLSYLGVKYRLSRVMQPLPFDVVESLLEEDDEDDPAMHRISKPSSFLY